MAKASPQKAALAEKAAITKSAPAKKASPETAAEEIEAAEATKEASEPTDFDHLLDAIRAVDEKFAQTSKEGDQVFFKRMITAISEFPEDPDDENVCPLFDGLPKSAQDWYNAQGALMNDGKSLLPPDGFASKFGGAAPAKSGKAAKENAAKGEKAPKEKKAKAAKADAPKRESKITIRIREVIYEDPARDLEGVMAELKKRGFGDIKRSTVSTCRSGCMMTVGVLKKLFPKQNLWK